MARGDTVLVVKPPERCVRLGMVRRQRLGRTPRAARSSGEVGHGIVVVVLVLRVEAVLLAAERPGLVQQLPGGGAARDLRRLAVCWPFTLS